MKYTIFYCVFFLLLGCPSFLFSLGGLLDSLSNVKVTQKTTIVVDNCIVPFPGVKVPCDMPLDADGKISITDLKCVDDPKRPYCVKCVEVVPGSKTCKVYDIDGTEITS